MILPTKCYSKKHLLGKSKEFCHIFWGTLSQVLDNSQWSDCTVWRTRQDDQKGTQLLVGTVMTQNCESFTYKWHRKSLYLALFHSKCKCVLPSVCIRQQIALFAYHWFRPNNRMVHGHWLAIYTFRPPGNSRSLLLLSFHRSSSPLSFSLLNLALKNSFLFTRVSVHPQQKANTHP